MKAEAELGGGFGVVEVSRDEAASEGAALASGVVECLMDAFAVGVKEVHLALRGSTLNHGADLGVGVGLHCEVVFARDIGCGSGRRSVPCETLIQTGKV